MKLIVFGSHLCPDTLGALQRLYEAGIAVSYHDILSCHADLRAYLQLRDNHEAYREIRGTERLGVPCFVFDDGSLTLELSEALQRVMQQKESEANEKK